MNLRILQQFGTGTEPYAQSVDPSIDAVAAAGFAPQYGSSNDQNAIVTRDSGGNLVFTDAVTGSKTLAQLAAAASASIGPPPLVIANGVTYSVPTNTQILFNMEIYVQAGGVLSTTGTGVLAGVT